MDSKDSFQGSRDSVFQRTTEELEALLANLREEETQRARVDHHNYLLQLITETEGRLGRVVSTTAWASHQTTEGLETRLADLREEEIQKTQAEHNKQLLQLITETERRLGRVASSTASGTRRSTHQLAAVTVRHEAYSEPGGFRGIAQEIGSSDAPVYELGIDGAVFELSADGEIHEKESERK